MSAMVSSEQAKFTAPLKSPSSSFKETKDLMAGLYTGFLPRGVNLEYVKKRGGEAVRSYRAAAGGWVQEGDVPPPVLLI